MTKELEYKGIFWKIEGGINHWLFTFCRQDWVQLRLQEKVDEERNETNAADNDVLSDLIFEKEQKIKLSF